MPRAAPGSARPTSRTWRRLLAALALGAAASLAQAQPEVRLAPSAEQACLAPAEDVRARPVYPERELRLKDGTTVRVELEFDGPDERPSVHFLDGNHVAAFEDAVREYARQLRVPCMKAGAAPVKLRQDLVFEPNDGRKVVWSAATDEADTQRRKLLACGTWPQGRDGHIDYPATALRERLQGLVVVRLRFVAPDAPPQLEVVDDAGSSAFIAAVRPYVEQMRVPCLQDEPVDFHMFFHFWMDTVASRKRVLKDLDLVTYLGVVSPVRGVYFDTNTMHCPFDVRLKFRQPFEPNGISELESDDPSRHVFLEWLGGLKLDIDAHRAKDLFGQTSTLHVPCVKLDL